MRVGRVRVCSRRARSTGQTNVPAATLYKTVAHARVRRVCCFTVCGFPQVSAGADHSCGVTVDGALLCWGANECAVAGAWQTA